MDDDYKDSRITYHKRKRWTQSEDELLVMLVERYGTTEWAMIAKGVENRNSQQCRERWLNHVDPSIDKSPFSEEEWKIVVNAQKSKGNSWSEISELLHGRTAVHIKNEWHRRKRKDYNRSKDKKSKSSVVLTPTRVSDPGAVGDKRFTPTVQAVNEGGSVVLPTHLFNLNCRSSHSDQDLPPLAGVRLLHHMKVGPPVTPPAVEKHNPMRLENILTSEIEEKSISLEASIQRLKQYMGIEADRKPTCDIPPTYQSNTDEFLFTPEQQTRKRPHEAPLENIFTKQRRTETNTTPPDKKWTNLFTIANLFIKNEDTPQHQS